MSYYRQPPFRAYGSGGAIGAPPLTPVVKLLLVSCCAVWAIEFVVEKLVGYGDLIFLFGIVPPLVVGGYVWQPFTYMFLHATSAIWHLLFNMLVLYMVGGELERHWGGKRFLTYYLVCGVGAGICVTVAGLLSGSELPTIGASGAILGLILAYGVVFADRVVLFMLIFPMKARTLAWIVFAVALFYTWEARADGVSHVAHLGGMVVGYLYLKRAWRVGEFYRELRWRVRRRRFRVMPPRDQDPWIH